MITITIACPVGVIEDAGQLARCIGYGEADGDTFTDAQVYVDSEGHRYAVPHGPVHEAFLTNALVPLAVPVWGADMDAAARAQAMVALWQPPDEGAVVEPFAAPDRIAAVAELDLAAALAVLGLVREVQNAEA
ncbi:hypothetical protein [Gemmobacter serpentinus]|uniref:hypothetical protein n=1 Tax=Gemmobacter serpentinus TaxID=2652247 RepID=UPI00124C0D37|nr:hypothetical protein [Gemmobacter serpentinus]